jgi:carbon storage regulator
VTLGAEPRGTHTEERTMLVLSRKIGQTLVITQQDGTEIKVQVVDVKKKQVKLGIEAPKSVPVRRGELEAVK